jgi:predicted GNAT family acetyltransferase
MTVWGFKAAVKEKNTGKNARVTRAGSVEEHRQECLCHDMPIQVTFFDNPTRVLAEAGAFLASEPVLHNIILTLLHARVAQPVPGRYWAARNGEDVAGVVFQSPLNFAATITPMPADVVVAMVDLIVDSGVDLPGVNGEAATTARFAGHWTERSKSAAVPFQGLRLYELVEVRYRPEASGRLRQAVPGDREILVEWVRRFQIEIGEQHSEAAAMVDQWLPAGHLWIWDDGEPVSMAVTREAVEGVVRVAGVYTPAAKRNRGYAGASVSDLSKQICNNGHRPILYTDLGNPTSNSIYRRIGYRAVAEALRYRFE